MVKLFIILTLKPDLDIEWFFVALAYKNARIKERRGKTGSGKTGRVENRLAPALPHQTVHALLTHTAFRCSSHQGMHIYLPIYSHD